MTVAPPLCALLSSFLPPFSTCKVCPMSTNYADLGPHMYAVHVRPPHHTITHPTALLPPTDETISRNLYRPQLPTHRAYSFSCFVSSELSWYVQPDTKTYQVTIWRRLSPTDINVGTWVFVIDFGKRVYGGNISMKENIQYGWCPSHKNCPNPLSNKCLCNLCNLNQWNVWGWQCEVKACFCKIYHLHSNTLIKIL